MSSIRNNPEAHVEAVIELAMQTAEMVVSMRENGLQNIEQKSSSIDIVTEADVAAENKLREGLHAFDSELGFWGEESNRLPEEDAFWIVDPIDGTNNFAMGLPYYAVNIALNECLQTLLGVTVELPVRNVYWSVAGKGAHRRGADGSEGNIHVSNADSLADVFLTTGFPYHRREHPDNNQREYAALLNRAQGVRCLGASALDLVYVAQGVLGGCWEGWLKPWDAAAGALLVREAGGKVTNYGGNDWSIRDQSTVASNGAPGIHQAMLDTIHEARQGLEESLL